MFIAEYVQSKHKDIYRDAGMMYNELNKQYPRKPDLRKTQEFRQWKNKLAKANDESPVRVPKQKKYQYKRTTYWDIELEDTETKPETPPLKDQTPSNDMMMCLNIPLMDTSTYNSSQATVLEEGDQTATQEDDQTTDIDQTPPPFDPSILDGIPPETIEKIIQELRADPYLKDIVEDVEQEISTTEDVQQEIFGLEVELPELYDPLEEELELW